MARANGEYSVQEVSDILGVGIDKLRRWDALGVLVARRTEGGHRRYAREVVDALAEAGAARGERSDEAGSTAPLGLLRNPRIVELLVESEERYRTLVEGCLDLIWTADALGRLTFVSGAAESLLGAKPRALIGRSLFDFDLVGGAEANRRLLALLGEHGVVRHRLTALTAADGTERWVGISAELVRDAQGGVNGIRGSLRDVTESHRATERMERLSLHDALTGLPNRLSLQRALEGSMGPEETGAVIFIDVDHFRHFNNTVGYREADRVIKAIGGVLRESALDHGGEVFRLGGDTFAVRVHGARRAEAVDVAEAMLSRVRHFPLQTGQERRAYRLTASAGIAVYPFQGADAMTLLAAADAALHQAKDLGRNRAAVYCQGSEALKSTTLHALWAKQLHGAIRDGRLVLFVQPVVRLADRTIVHQEVLARLRDPDGKLLLPGQFLDPAESLGMIQQIDLLVVESLIKRLEAPGGSPLKHFVNLSHVSISDPYWTRRLFALLQHAGPVRHRLVFEVSESAALTEVSVTKGFIKGLRQIGCEFSLDDFGSGFTSFQHLRGFDVDFLKLDGCVSRDLATNQPNPVFVKALCDLGCSLSKGLIAKSIETPEVVAALTGIGVEYGQGRLFRHPHPIDDADDRGPGELAPSASVLQ
jgi:diguanylate cyclase (GGDEF)-like protein/PAS domain S-box-containing protein